jgi:acetyl-CoA carboxylase biotin carboxyl carrier protein
MSDQETQQPNEERSPKSNRDERPERSGRDRGRRRHQQQPQQHRRPEAAINMDELRELVELIAQHGFTDFELEREGIRVRLRRELAPQIVAATAPLPPSATSTVSPTAETGPTSTAAPAQSSEAEKAAAAATEASAQQAAEDERLHTITSPIVGTFYRSPSPAAEPFIRLGSHVDPDTVVCIIEAMKLMNEIQAETRGEVAKIYVENGQAVEYGQPLFGIKK